MLGFKSEFSPSFHSESDSGDERTDAVQTDSHQGPTPRGLLLTIIVCVFYITKSFLFSTDVFDFLIKKSLLNLDFF